MRMFARAICFDYGTTPGSHDVCRVARRDGDSCFALRDLPK